MQRPTILIHHDVLRHLNGPSVRRCFRTPTAHYRRGTVERRGSTKCHPFPKTDDGPGNIARGHTHSHPHRPTGSWTGMALIGDANPIGV